MIKQLKNMEERIIMKTISLTRKKMDKWLDRYYQTHDIDDTYFLVRHDHQVEIISFIQVDSLYRECLPIENDDSFKMTMVSPYLDKFDIIESFNLEETRAFLKRYGNDYTFIDDCFTFNLFDDEEWFEDCFEQKIPKSFLFITKKLERELKSAIRTRKKDYDFQERMKKQRYERGYSDSDVWNMFDWFIDTARPILKQLVKEHHGFPSTLDVDYFEKHKQELGVESYDEWVVWPHDENSEGYRIRSEANKSCSQQWEDILNRLIFLLDEMDENTCSLHNPYEEKWWDYHQQFSKKYPKHGDELKTDEELQRDRESHTWLHVGPERDPDFGDDYKKITKKFLDYDRKIAKYRDTCKNEFFKLFSKYFWDLWD